MKMGISWNYSICYCYNDYDTRSLTTSGLLPYFLLDQKVGKKSRLQIKKHFALHQG